jgi:pimeloyl-ACP methyl ester carboxylesterase
MTSTSRLRYVEAKPSASARLRGTLVLLQAFPLNARMWEPQLAMAENGWRVLAPHFRGMDDPAAAASESTGQPAAWPTPTVDDYAGDVIDLLDWLKVEDAVFVGLSMGGYVSFALFRLAARYVRGLVLADTRATADTPEAVEGRKRLLGVLREHGAAAVADEMIPKLLGATTQREQPVVADGIRSLVLSNPASAIAGAIHVLMTRPDSTGTLASIHCPTLIIVGEEDTLTPPAMSRDMLRAIGGSELTVIPKAGHLSSIETPELFNAALARFLEHRI